MGSRSSSQTTQETTISTETETNIRDIGFTGQQAVDFLDIIESGSVKRAQIQSDTLQLLAKYQIVFVLF